MKKTATLLTGLLFLVFFLHAQKKQSKFLTELSVGPSFPLGRFAATSYKDDKNEVPGFAKTGLAAHLSVGYYLNKSVGLLLSSGYTVHPQDKDHFRREIESSIPGVTLTHFELKNWKTVKLMGGGFVVTPLTSEGELVLLAKLTAGVSKFDIPKREFWGSNQDGTSTISSIDNGGSLPWSFCYQVSLALEYKLNRSLYALLDINSFNTTAKKEFNYTIIPGSGIPPTAMTIKNKYKQATVNAMLGIGVRF
jgi:hypothetical protein